MVTPSESGESAESARPYRTLFAALERQLIFQDLSVFDTEYIPEQILIRKEFDPIIRFYFDCLSFKLQQALIIVGPTGSGKTLASRYYSRQAQGYAQEKGVAFTTIYVNCREIGSLYGFWELLLATLDRRTKKGLAISNLVDRFLEAIAKKHHVVLILDEMEKLYTTIAPERVNDLLYLLTRAKGNRSLAVSISLVLISNNAHLTDYFDAPVKSSLNAKHIVIGNYDARELAEILRNRAAQGLKAGAWSEKAINYIAAKTAQFNSDARFAIKLLRNAAATAESSGQPLGLEQVDEAFEVTKRELEQDVIKRLSTNQLMILQALAKEAVHQRTGLLRLHDVHRSTYAELCARHKLKPLVYSHFLSIVASLQNYDLINNILERRRSGGYIRLAEVNFKPADLEQLLEERLGAFTGAA
jgi:cell division control protein 6